MPSPAQTLRLLTAYALAHDIASSSMVRALWLLSDASTDCLTRALQVIGSLRHSRAELGNKPLDHMERRVRDEFRCWALHIVRRFPGFPGYPSSFVRPTLFPGRTTTASLYPPPSPAERQTKPWLEDLPRLIFLNDMGDALSAAISFEELHREIVAPCSTTAGARHIWLWLSKRPARMAEFSRWLESQGVSWPKNLVPMTSPMTAGYARAATALLEIPAEAYGFSAEPWDTWVELPEELFTPRAWFILGGESGGAARLHPFQLEWARRLRDQVAERSGSFFLKQLGRYAYDGGERFHTGDLDGGEWDQWPHDLRIRQWPEAFRHLTSTT